VGGGTPCSWEEKDVPHLTCPIFRTKKKGGRDTKQGGGKKKVHSGIERKGEKGGVLRVRFSTSKGPQPKEKRKGRNGMDLNEKKEEKDLYG